MALLAILYLTTTIGGSPEQADIDRTANVPASAGDAQGPARTAPRLISDVRASSDNDAAASTGYGQITMYNKTSVTLDLYVDGNYGCRALKNFFCTTQVKAGSHTLTAKTADGRSVSASVTLRAGESVTWTVTEE